MAVLAARAGCRFAEVPIHFGERRAGHSKMTPYVQLRTTFEIVVLPWVHRRAAPQTIAADLVADERPGAVSPPPSDTTRPVRIAS
jgi:hypothetical protein